MDDTKNTALNPSGDPSTNSGSSPLTPSSNPAGSVPSFHSDVDVPPPPAESGGLGAPPPAPTSPIGGPFSPPVVHEEIPEPTPAPSTPEAPSMPAAPHEAPVTHPPVDEHPVEAPASPATTAPGGGFGGLPPVITPPQKAGKGKMFAAIAGIILLLVSIPVGVILVRQNLEVREKASISDDSTGDYPFTCETGCPEGTSGTCGGHEYSPDSGCVCETAAETCTPDEPSGPSECTTGCPSGTSGTCGGHDYGDGCVCETADETCTPDEPDAPDPTPEPPGPTDAPTTPTPGGSGQPASCDAANQITDNMQAPDGQSLSSQSCSVIEMFVNGFAGKAGRQWASEHVCGSLIQASDGRVLSDESISIVDTFLRTHGADACRRWAEEHNSQLGAACQPTVTFENIDPSWRQPAGSPVTVCAPQQNVNLRMTLTLPAGCSARTVSWNRTQANCPGTPYAACPGPAGTPCSAAPVSENIRLNDTQRTYTTSVSCDVPNSCGSCQVDYDNFAVDGSAMPGVSEGIRAFMNNCGPNQCVPNSAIQIYKYPYDAQYLVASSNYGSLRPGDPIKICIAPQGTATPQFRINGGSQRAAQENGPGGTKCLQYDIPGDATTLRVSGEI